MSKLEQKRIREAHDNDVRDRIPRVQQTHRRLQSAIQTFNADPWPTSIFPSLAFNKNLIESNTSRLRHSFRICEAFAVDMGRKTENLNFLDHRFLELHDTIMASQEPVVAEIPKELDFNKRYVDDQPYTVDGNEAPKYEVKVKRETYRLSISGIACMEL